MNANVLHLISSVFPLFKGGASVALLFEVKWTSSDENFRYSKLPTIAPEMGGSEPDLREDLIKLEHLIVSEIAVASQCNPKNMRVRINRASSGSFEVLGEIEAWGSAAWSLIQIMAAIGGAVEFTHMVKRAIARAFKAWHGDGVTKAYVVVKKTMGSPIYRTLISLFLLCIALAFFYLPLLILLLQLGRI